MMTGKRPDAMARMYEALEENMLQLAFMEESRVEREKEHSEELEKVRGHMEGKSSEDKQALSRQHEQEVVKMKQDMTNFQAECEKLVANEKLECERQLAAMRINCEKRVADKMAEIKAETAREIADVRAQCDRMMSEERNEMADKIAESRAHCERMAAEKEGMSGRIAEFREETERYIAHEKAEMLRKTSESRAECERIAREKAEMMREMARFQEQTQLKMAQEKAELSRTLAESREQCERKIAEEKVMMERKIAGSKVEYERIEEEKLQVMRELAKFRTETERSMAEEHEGMQKKLHESRAICERKIAEEKLEMAREMAELRVEFERKMLQENDNYAKKISEARAECERMAEQKLMMTKEIAKIRTESEAKIGEEKAALMQQVVQMREEYETLAKQKAQKEKEMTKLRADTELKMIEMTKKTAEARAECEKLENEKSNLTKDMAKFRKTTEKKMADEQAEMRKRIQESRQEYEQIVVQKAELAREMAAFRNKTEQKMADVTAKMAESRLECEKLARQKQDMEEEMKQIRTQTLKKLEQEKEEMTFQMNKTRVEYEEQLESEKKATLKLAKQKEEMEADITSKMATQKKIMEADMLKLRTETLKKLQQEKEDMTNQMNKSRRSYEEQLESEKKAAGKRLAAARAETESQLQAEREVTSHIMQVIRELPPLQAAIELGDIKLLEEELEKWEADSLPERFGECKSVVDAVIKIAKERLITWREVEMTLHDVLRQVERLPGSVASLSEHCGRLFRALKEAQLTKMDLRRSDPQASEKICDVLLAWQSKAMTYSNSVQKAMIRKVATAPQLGAFDFADLDICLRLVDRNEAGSEVLLTRALAIVQDKTTHPNDLKPLLAHLETMLFFLKYTRSEDLALTHAEFAKQKNIERDVSNYIRWAAMECPPGSELVQLRPGRDIMDRKDVTSVLEEMRQVRFGVKDSLGVFREIFYQWAMVMRERFDLLVLPHHTQVVCLMIFRRFLEAATQGIGPHALIAQVGTGEGKSMIIAALVIYIVVVFKNKVHVVVDDETLLERDYYTFKRLFDAFKVPIGQGRTRPLTSAICVSEERMAAAGGKSKHLVSRVDPDVDVCYCEAKHVQSFYASIARGQRRDFEGYDQRVLILDEVDALVIDEEPNEAFVYPNRELSKMATSLADMLKRGASGLDLDMFRNGDHPASQRVYREITAEWARGMKMTAGEDYVYSKEIGRYLSLQSGRANPKAWSLALECRNFADGLSREIIFQERLFVMSRPRVFRKYFRILGLSGSIGSAAERTFLKETYQASFFEVPPFLKTCRGSPFHDPVPAPLGELRRAVYVEDNSEAQLKRLCEVALAARERVPVLVIAKDRAHCDVLVEGLRTACRSRGLGGSSLDLVRSLARTLYEADPEQWKENLNRATLPLGLGLGDANQQGGKSWRVTVTDPRGGRGTDYRVDFKEVDDAGGLLLIPTQIPSAQRDWTQFLGRTARQDRKGQFCAVLCKLDYDKLSQKYSEPLPVKGGLETVDTVLSWGDREVAERIRKSAALYNCGVRMNELCEFIFSKHQKLLDTAHTRERLVEVCQRFRFMSVKEIDEAFAKIPRFDPKDVLSASRDLGRPAEPPQSGTHVEESSNTSRGVMRRETFGRKNSQGQQQFLRAFEAGVESPGVPPRGLKPKPMVEVPRLVVFCLDWSASMMSQDTGRRGVTRFGVCVERVQSIIREQVRERDLVGVVGFGANFQTAIAPTVKGNQSHMIETHIGSLRPSQAGGTCFYDAVAHCLQMMSSCDHAPYESPRWLLCLTDGDDLGSRRENANGEVVNHMLDAGVTKLNMIMITVGQLQAKTLRIVSSWVDRVSRNGGHAQHLSERDAVSIGKAFEVVAEALAADVGGAIEC